MPSSLHSRRAKRHESTGRTIRSPFLFPSLPAEIQHELRIGAIARHFDDGQIIQHRGEISDGFWVIESGQVKMGRYEVDGEMRVVAILGPQDSFGEPSCLGQFPRVADAVALGSTELLWIGEKGFYDALEKSPTTARTVLRIVSVQLQEALDTIMVVRKMPAKAQLARSLVALCGQRPAPVTLAVRHDELSELVGVSRMTIGTALAALEREGLVSRRYRQIVVHDPAALRQVVRRARKSG
jgi:CRP/FNR family transcriptional regulator, cyclic AMP receptor protein